MGGLFSSLFLPLISHKVPFWKTGFSLLVKKGQQKGIPIWAEKGKKDVRKYASKGSQKGSVNPLL